MSGVCPFADAKLIPAGSNDPRIDPRVAILHVDAGDAYDLYDFFAHRSGGIESHFHIARDGHLFQYRDIYWQADANHLANDFAVSIETQGWGSGEWTPEQLATIKRLLVWLHGEAGIPLRKCPSWNGSGVGYHIQFGTPGMWTPVAKSCPGPDRVRQYHDVLVPWMDQGATEPTPEEEDEMKPEDWKRLDRKLDNLKADVLREINATWDKEIKVVGTEEHMRTGQMLGQVHHFLRRRRGLRRKG